MLVFKKKKTWWSYHCWRETLPKSDNTNSPCREFTVPLSPCWTLHGHTSTGIRFSASWFLKILFPNAQLVWLRLCLPQSVVTGSIALSTSLRQKSKASHTHKDFSIYTMQPKQCLHLTRWIHYSADNFPIGSFNKSTEKYFLMMAGQSITQM